MMSNKPCWMPYQIMTLVTTKNFYTHYQVEIDQYLDTWFRHNYSDSRDHLNDAMRYSLLSKSKRVRPLLVLATASLQNKDLTPFYPLAAAIECIHTYSLIHDDLPAMDDDDLRRGQPTSHIKYDEATAILAGDCLNTIAYQLISDDLAQHFDSEKIVAVIQQMSRLTGQQGLIGGQMIDIQASSKTLSLEKLRLMHSLKTGALITLSITLPSLLIGFSTHDHLLLEQFSKHVGIMFQIQDDILDYTSSADVLGKTPQKDVSQDKGTYVSILGMDGAKDALAEEIKQARSSIEKTSLDTTVLSDFVDILEKRTY